MSKDIRESVSALMDGEASELELRRLLQADSEEVSVTWSRFHAQRSALHGEPKFSGMDVSGAVRAALAGEEPLQRGMSLDWRKPLGGFAIAASVAALVVFGLGGTGQQQAEQLAASGSGPETSGRVYLSAPAAVTTGTVNASTASGQAPRFQSIADEQARQRFERLLQQHSERAAVSSGQGMVTYVRLASHGAK